MKVRLVMALFAVPALASAQDDTTGSVEEEDDAEHYGIREAARDRSSVRLTGRRALVVPELYTVRRGDTLWDICDHFYGNPWQWPRVWSFNDRITNPNWIYPGDPVRLRRGGGPDAVGSVTPRPRKESEASSRIAWAMNAVNMMRKGATTFGAMWRKMMRGCP